MNGPLRLLLAAVVGIAVSLCVWFVGQAVNPTERRRSVARSQSRVDPRAAMTAAIGGFVTLLVTRWPAAAVGVSVLVLGWRHLFVAADATKSRRRLDGIAKWLEDLRDLQQGSNLDLIETLTQASGRAPKAIEQELLRFASRVSHHVPLSEALAALADELDHPVADTAAASMIFASGHASGSALFDTFAQLAATARDELTARDQIDRMRLNFERSMRRMIVILAVLLAYMVLVAGETLKPYKTATGQLWMVIPILIWAAALLWLRRLSRYERTSRYLQTSAVTEAVLR
jgi:hypothetical protein